MFVAWSYREYTDSWMGGSVYLHPGKLDLIPAGLMQVEEPRSVNRPSPCSLVCLPAVLEAAARGSPGPWHLQPPVQRGGLGMKQSSQPWWGSQASPGTEPLQGAVGSSCLNVAPSASVAPCASSTSAQESGPRRARQPACLCPSSGCSCPPRALRETRPKSCRTSSHRAGTWRPRWGIVSLFMSWDSWANDHTCVFGLTWLCVAQASLTAELPADLCLLLS